MLRHLCNHDITISKICQTILEKSRIIDFDFSITQDLMIYIHSSFPFFWACKFLSLSYYILFFLQALFSTINRNFKLSLQPFSCILFQSFLTKSFMFSPPKTLIGWKYPFSRIKMSHQSGSGSSSRSDSSSSNSEANLLLAIESDSE